jgi:hypothetical protein
MISGRGSVMDKCFVLLVSGLLALPLMTPAHASGDFGCTVEWKLVNPARTGCANMPALGPGNDTRVNLLLLLFDRHGTPPEQASPAAQSILIDWPDFRDRFFPAAANDSADYADGEGSRCRSNASGATGFEAALDATPELPPDERATLLAARKALSPTCADKGAPVDDAVQHLHSAPGQAFAAYLRGAAAFYDGRFDEAAAAFAALQGNGQPWLADAAAYMVARVEVNRLQVGAFDEYGLFKGSADVDQQVATRAEASLEAYLRDHPGGQYAASARGLLRRVDWLAGRTDKLAAQYAALLATPPAAPGLGDAALAEEIDNKLLPQLTPQMTSDPTLLAVVDLKRMRQSDHDRGAPIGLDELEAQRPAFAAASPLFDYLLAVHAFYIDHANAIVLQLLPDATGKRDGDYLWFSRQLLRGMALEAVGDRNAGGFWTEFYPGATRPLERAAIELGLAMHDESHGRLKDVFAAGSLVESPAIREILLDNVADAALLRQQAHDPAAPAHEREIALFALLFKELTRARYADFLADVAGAPPEAPAQGDGGSGEGAHPPLRVFTATETLEDFDCPPVRTTAAQLARDPQSTRARLCLAEFVRVKGFDEETVDIPPPKDQLGGTPSLFQGKPYARAATYQSIIADAGAPAADRAFALYRAVNCYAPVGVNQCGGPTAPLAQRKAWFSRLKRDYSSSRWAKELIYWW